MFWCILDAIRLASAFEALPKQTLTFADLILLQGSKHPWKYRYQPNTVMTDFCVS